MAALLAGDERTGADLLRTAEHRSDQHLRGAPADAAGAMREVLWFYRCGRETFCEASGERLLDWDEDWLCIWADFRLYAGIDLDCGQLHWWRFMALFESLPRESGIKRRIWLRSLDPAEIRRRPSAGEIPPDEGGGGAGPLRGAPGAFVIVGKDVGK